jgi:hypothetical protein
MLELVLARHEIEAAISIMKRGVAAVKDQLSRHTGLASVPP